MEILQNALSYITEALVLIGSAVEIISFLIPVFIAVFLGVSLLLYSDHLAYRRLVNSRITEIDKMDPRYYRYFIGAFLEILGYLPEKTSEPEDQESSHKKIAVDALVKKDNIRYAVLAERKKKGVGSRTFQRLKKAMEEYNCQGGIIINNGYFSNTDLQEGRSMDIETWDRDKLIKELLMLQGKEDPRTQGWFFYLSDYWNWILRG